jgi:hypothetical protein
MTDPPNPSSNASAAQRPANGVVADERGAILVMGIFMCACMVGILWYLAGIGDAIMYRERMQEASDATAYSAAVLHARGMNLLVMINFIMACVLAVRVALKVAVIVLTVLGIAFSWIGIGEALLTAAEAVQKVADIAKPFIDGALEGLTVVEQIIPRVVPAAALLGSVQVGDKYAPIKAAAGNPVTVINGLPVTDGSNSVLCYQAGKAVVDIIGAVLPIPKSAISFAGGAFGDLVAAGGDYFCELGGSSGAPDLSGLINGNVDKGCDDRLDQLKKERDDAQRAYQDECNSLRAPCANDLAENETPKTPTPTQQASLNQKQGKAATAQAEVDKFDGDKCRKDQKDKINQKLNSQNSSSSGGGGKIAPRRVIDDWQNGVPNAQMVAVALGDEKMLKVAPKGVVAGQWKSGATISIPKTADFGLAQAEFFYDCSGKWKTNSCNGTGRGVDKKELAMWNFRWRARLRRYNEPFKGNVPGLETLGNALVAGELISKAAHINPLNSLTVDNAALLSELGDILLSDPNTLIIH